MVGFTTDAPETRVRRMAEALREADMPGDREDHTWIARGLDRCLRRVEPVSRHREFLEPLLVAGLLRERGMEPRRAPRAHFPGLPEEWVRAVPPLLKSGFPENAWVLVESMVLRVDGRSPDGRRRWRVDGAGLREPGEVWFELGERLAADTVSRAVIPLAREEEAGIELRVAGLGTREGKSWARTLRRTIEWRAPGTRIHVFAG